VAKEFYELIRGFGGLSLEYSALTEADFTATAGSAYVPPERGDFRRINVTRTLQLLMDAPGVIETFQTSAAELRLPANTITKETNDAGNGRLFFLKNSGTGNIVIKDYLGTTLWTVLQYGIVMVVGNDNNNWDFYFKAQNIPHDVIVSMETSTNVQTGLEYLMKLFRDVQGEPTGFPRKYTDSILTFDNGTRTFSIAPKTPTYTSFEYYIRGKVYTVTTTHSYVVTDTEGLWYFYFDASGVLRGSQTPWLLSDPVAIIATGYWDAANNLWIRDNEERHGTTMDYDTHRRMHLVEGSQIQTTYPQGLLITNYTDNGDGTLNSHAQYAITDGVYFDEDISIEIKHSASPANPFEQILYPIAYVPVFYLLNGGDWRKKNGTQFPIYENPPSLPYYNQNNAGTWSLQPVTNNYFFATWLIYSDALTEPVLTILGQRQDPDLISAVNNNTKAGLLLPRKFSEEFYFYKKIIWEASTSFTNTPKARIRFIAISTETAPANDRYLAICNYNGNAGTGKYLDFYPGQSSDLSPFPIPESTFVKTLILTAIASSTGTVSIYKSTDLVNPILNISLSTSKYQRVNIAYLLSSDDLLVAKVSAGSINKPALTMFFQTNL
jgi:hypothetical protein